MADNNYYDDDAYDDDEGFDGYKETTVDPGFWLLVGTVLACALLMAVIMPVLVYRTNKKRQEQEQKTEATSYFNATETSTMLTPGAAEEGVVVAPETIFKYDLEMKKLFGLAIPFTLSGIAVAAFEAACLIFVAQFLGTKALTAYAIVGILVSLPDAIIEGPLHACTTVCSHALGAGNPKLAGEYVQLSLWLYVLMFIPLAMFWWIYMGQIVLYLQWGDEEVAQHAENFVRVYIWSYVFDAVAHTMWLLLEVADHAIAGTVFDLIDGGLTVAMIAILMIVKENATLVEVALVFVASSVLGLFVTIVVVHYFGWLEQFYSGIFSRYAILDQRAIRLLLKQAVPIAFGEFFSNAEWAVLTVMASFLGPAEVAAWAILGSIWEIFESATDGICDAAEIRVSYHLGVNRPLKAQLSAYKSLFMGMAVASLVSILFFALSNYIPGWFTVDETLQDMLRGLIPFVGVANLAMTFGIQCWSLVGAQGKYKLATWVGFISSWAVCMPLAAVFVYLFRIDLQGLTAAVVMGYASSSAVLSYLLLSSDWKAIALKISKRNEEEDSSDEEDDDDESQDEDALGDGYAFETRVLSMEDPGKTRDPGEEPRYKKVFKALRKRSQRVEKKILYYESKDDKQPGVDTYKAPEYETSVEVGYGSAPQVVNKPASEASPKRSHSKKDSHKQEQKRKSVFRSLGIPTKFSGLAPTHSFETETGFETTFAEGARKQSSGETSNTGTASRTGDEIRVAESADLQKIKAQKTSGSKGKTSDKATVSAGVKKAQSPKRKFGTGTKPSAAGTKNEVPEEKTKTSDKATDQAGFPAQKSHLTETVDTKAAASVEPKIPGEESEFENMNEIFISKDDTPTQKKGWRSPKRSQKATSDFEYKAASEEELPPPSELSRIGPTRSFETELGFETAFTCMETALTCGTDNDQSSAKDAAMFEDQGFEVYATRNRRRHGVRNQLRKMLRAGKKGPQNKKIKERIERQMEDI